MFSAQLLTIGTEITSGEVLNSNASWLSLRLEELGLRVLSHLSVRDDRDEIAQALAQLAGADLIFVTGGLGPTSDDVTRECMALFTGDKLEFDEQVWRDLQDLYARRGLPLREAHKWQCNFPRTSTRLKNPIGTALGFYQNFNGRHYFVLPGPPREIEGMWSEEVKPRVTMLLKPGSSAWTRWTRWTCLGVPESEVAEKVEPIIKDTGIEIGYRAQVPYVKIKIYADPLKDAALIAKIGEALKPWVVAHGHDDLAAELLRRWPAPSLKIVDLLTDARIARRLFEQKIAAPELEYHTRGEFKEGIFIHADGEQFVVEVKTDFLAFVEKQILPFKVDLQSERGKRSVTEWALWIAVKHLRINSALLG